MNPPQISFSVLTFRISIGKFFSFFKIIPQNHNFSFGSNAYRSRNLYSLILYILLTRLLEGKELLFFFVSSGANPLYDDSIVNR